MADAPKDKGGDKKSSGGSASSGLSSFLAIMLILFILWVISGGPERNPESRTNQFIEPIGINGHNGETYRDDPFGQPGSVTNILPFFK
ncbi:MAG TPA: hypothetical protein PKZ56_00850 [Candidatus Paceibacterota bacterium]|nr:hypothetical protein [Candidatus Paceibacterota bacterium]